MFIALAVARGDSAVKSDCVDTLEYRSVRQGDNDNSVLSVQFCTKFKLFQKHTWDSDIALGVEALAVKLKGKSLTLGPTWW